MLHRGSKVLNLAIRNNDTVLIGFISTFDSSLTSLGLKACKLSLGIDGAFLGDSLASWTLNVSLTGSSKSSGISSSEASAFVLAGP